MESNLPAFQFYPADWLTSSKVRLLSLEEKGFYIELLCHLHKGAHRGKLCDENGTPYTTEEVSLLMGYPLSLVEICLTKFLTKKILEVEEGTGIIFQPRMVRDENLRQIRKNCGKLGGNPLLVNQKPTTPLNQKPTPSSSSSSSSSIKEIHKESAEQAKQTTEAFASFCPSLPQIKKLDKRRISAVFARYAEHKKSFKDFEDFLKGIFQMVEASDFLTGRSSDWQASFDWIFKPTNFRKIIEGNYKNREGKTNGNAHGKTSRNAGTYNEHADYSDVDKR